MRRFTDYLPLRTFQVLRPWLWLDQERGERFYHLSLTDQRIFLLFIAEASDE